MYDKSVLDLHKFIYIAPIKDFMCWLIHRHGLNDRVRVDRYRKINNFFM